MSMLLSETEVISDPHTHRDCSHCESSEILTLIQKNKSVVNVKCENIHDQSRANKHIQRVKAFITEVDV